MGPAELQARQLLLAMQERLSRDPFEALGLGSSNLAEVRSAFLALTKTYHPARFARMAPEIQRLSNEVFLGLRAAHDQLSRAQVKSPARSTAVLPTFKPAPTSPPVPGGRVPTGAIPIMRPPTSSTPTPVAAAPPRMGPQGQVTRSPVPASAARTPSTTSSKPTSQTTQSMRPLANSPNNPNLPDRPPRMPSSSPPPASSQAPVRPAGGATHGPETEVAAIHELLVQDRLTDARMKLEGLVARNPNVPRYQAMIHYAKGREAQLAGRRDEARLELLDALDLDRDLQLANTALGELLSKRK